MSVKTLAKEWHKISVEKKGVVKVLTVEESREVRRTKKEKIVPSKSRNLRLAILGSDTVDVRDLDLPSLLFHPGDVEPKFRKKRKRGKFKDLDRDGDKDLPLKIRLDRANLPLGLQEVCMTGLISFDPFQSCVEVELLENTNESRKKGRGCRPRGASK